MKVFISWSGKRSEAVAELLSSWIKCVLQATRPWISTQDIGRGAQWLNEINDQLKDTSVGIVCLTQENRQSPWIHFEAGALAKGLSANRVCTFLIDLTHSDVQQPLAQFNHTTPERASVWKLVTTLNQCLEPAGLAESVLLEVFDTYWPKFEERFNQIKADVPESTPSDPRSSDDMLKELLENSRSTDSRLRNLEHESTLSRVERIERIQRNDPRPAMEAAEKDAIRLAKRGVSKESIIHRLVNSHGLGEAWSRHFVENVLPERLGASLSEG